MQSEKLRAVGDWVWGWPLMLLFLFVGALYMVRLRGLPLRRLGKALGLIFHKNEAQGVSSYSALCAALAATIGTGNIVGVATALSAGGPGALLWMLVGAILGMATQYAEGYLAVRYRRKTEKGWFGGPFCYIEYGLGKKWKWLGKLFAGIGAAVGLLGVGTMTQSNSISTAVENFFDPERSRVLFCLGEQPVTLAALLCGLLVTVLSALVLLGGMQRIFRVCEALVPLMSAIYLLFSVIILLRCAPQLPAAVGLILRSAFSPRAAFGAAAGISLRTVLRMGIGRGVFTNEAGLGTTPIAAATVSGTDPVRQGLVSMTATFIDTIVICTITGLCLVVTGAWSAPFEGVGITDFAWRSALPWPEDLSSFLLMLCLVFFAFATIIGWQFYAERCLTYLTGEKDRVLRVYRLLYLCAVALGAFLPVTAVWELADIFNALMGLPNLAALLLLQNRVVEGTRQGLRAAI